MKVTPDALLQQWRHLQLSIQRVESANTSNLSQRIQTMSVESSVYDEMVKAAYMESLGEFPTK